MRREVSRTRDVEARASRFHSFAWALLLAWIVSAPIAAYAADVTGLWDLTASLSSEGCTWRGAMNLVQTGTMFTGSANLMRVAGVSCPTTISGTLSGTVSGLTIDFGLASGQFGSAGFSGTLSADGLFAAGTWSTDPDSGTWSARKQAEAAPALSSVALAALFGLLMVAGVLTARRRPV